MFGFAVYIILILFVITAVGKNKNKAGSSKSVKRISENALPAADFERKIKSAFPPASNYGDNADAVTKRKLGSFSDMEDRENDWLAKQLRDEARMKQNLGREMFDLKEEHIKEHDKING